MIKNLFSLNMYPYPSDLERSNLLNTIRKYTTKVNSDVEEVSSQNENLESNTKPTIVTYDQIYDLANLEKGLKRTKSGVAAGLDGELKANFTPAKLQALSKDLISQKYKATPTKRVMIPKADGGSRPLGISSQKDKVVQATFLVLMQPILEEIFRDCSMGFRPNRSCHTALHRIKRRWQNVT